MNAVTNGGGQTRLVLRRGVAAFVSLWLFLHHNGVIFYFLFYSDTE